MMTTDVKKICLDKLNFWLTNAWPRRRLSKWMGHISHIQTPRLTSLAIWIWNRFDPLELADSPAQRYTSIHECFTRPIRPETRPIDGRACVLTSPCDGLLGAHGHVSDSELFQVKGKPYGLEELVGDLPDIHPWREGYFVTLRIKSSMYHRFHAPANGCLMQARYFTGDAWNVNQPALHHVDRLYVKNERACLNFRLNSHEELALVPVAAILVAGIRVHALSNEPWVGAQASLSVEPPVVYSKGQEMGWFEHGSTIVMIAPRRYRLTEGLNAGDRLRMGQALLVDEQASA